jgi:hypothetical protein
MRRPCRGRNGRPHAVAMLCARAWAGAMVGIAGQDASHPPVRAQVCYTLALCSFTTCSSQVARTGSLALAQAIRHDRLTRTRVHCRACTRSPCRCARGAKNEPAAPVGLPGPHKTGAPPAMGICSCDHGTRIQKPGQRRL